MVMPRSRSRSFESMTRSATVSLAGKVALWGSMESTSVVLPWSTWAMMAMLRILGFRLKTPQGLRIGAYYYFTMAGSRWVGCYVLVVCHPERSEGSAVCRRSRRAKPRPDFWVAQGPGPRTGRALLQPCRPEPIKKRASAPAGFHLRDTAGADGRWG